VTPRGTASALVGSSRFITGTVADPVLDTGGNPRDCLLHFKSIAQVSGYAPRRLRQAVRLHTSIPQNAHGK